MNVKRTDFTIEAVEMGANVKVVISTGLELRLAEVELGGTQPEAAFSP